MADAVAQFPPDIASAETSRGRILVIDDEPDIRESLEALLTGENYRVELAANATEGLKKLETSSYDLVLLDLMMPDKSGMQVLEEIRLAGSRNADLSDHGLWLDSSGGGCAEARRERLFPEALGQREAADRDRSHDLASGGWSAKISSSSGR